MKMTKSVQIATNHHEAQVKIIKSNKKQEIFCWQQVHQT